MLFYLSELRRVFTPFNVFYYITFRALGAAITAFLISLLCGKFFIRRLISLKFGQPVRSREEVNRLYELHGRKAGTPTMGGVLIIASVLLSSLLWAKWENPVVWLALFTIVYLGSLGFRDDLLKITKRNSAGVSSTTKLLAQGVLAAGLVAYFLYGPKNALFEPALYVPFKKGPLIANLGAYFGIFAFLFYAAVIVGCSNAVNLTDGLDGLAVGCTITVTLAYAAIAYAAGNIKAATYLEIPFFPGCGELAVLCLAMAGAGLGFLWFNAYPAQMFMGDTGSLAIGGFIAVVAICCKQEILLILIGGVFVMETFSVMLQVVSFKTTGKRIFLMSPLHHHFELLGWKENTVIVRFWIMSIIFAVLGLATLKLR
jgi:phospho-N-acetylmuramoyl-pentapeptide-transferase